MSLVRHTTLNLVGLGAPLLAAAYAIPMLIGLLGTERFGLLTLVWAVVSYFGLFDLGLGRALTHQLAIAYTARDSSAVAEIKATGMVLMATIGVATGLGLHLASPFLVELLNAGKLEGEAVGAMSAMALSVPMIVLATGLRGILEARQRFDIVNAIRLPLGLFTFLGPLAVATWLGPRLDWIAYVLLCGRAVTMVVLGLYVLRDPEPFRGWSPSWLRVRPIAASGGWIAVSNTISPLMSYIDRFVLGANSGPQVVAYYATPQELVMKVWIVPGALTAALFPSVASASCGDKGEQERLYVEALQFIFVMLLPVTLALALLAPEALGLWLGPEMAANSTLALQVFALGMLVNSLATIPYTLLQGSGHARVTALIHLFEVPIFLIALWSMTSHFGLNGALAAWTLRVLIDTALMFHFNGRLTDVAVSRLLPVRQWLLVGVSMAAFLGILLQSLTLRSALLACVVVAVGAYAWPMLASRLREN